MPRWIRRARGRAFHSCKAFGYRWPERRVPGSGCRPCCVIELATSHGDEARRAYVWHIMRGVRDPALMQPLIAAASQGADREVQQEAVVTLATSWKTRVRAMLFRPSRARMRGPWCVLWRSAVCPESPSGMNTLRRPSRMSVAAMPSVSRRSCTTRCRGDRALIPRRRPRRRPSGMCWMTRRFRLWLWCFLG